MYTYISGLARPQGRQKRQKTKIYSLKTKTYSPLSTKTKLACQDTIILESSDFLAIFGGQKK